MARSVILYSEPWSDLSLEELAQKASEWGYQGLELCCCGDHFEVQRAATEPDYCQKKLDLLARYDLAALVMSNHRVGTAVCGPIDLRHRSILPEYVWGDGVAADVQQRAAEEMRATIRAAQKLGVAVVAGFTGSPLWSSVAGYPAVTSEALAAGLAEFAGKWNPILDVCRECSVRFAFEVHPGQIAFDIHSAQMALDALGGREEFGFTFDPSHLHWQGIDPAEFVRRFGDRIYHVHVKDAALSLDGRSGILNSYLPPGDPRRGWEFRAPGHGGIDWERVIRALNDVGYDGALSVEWKDAGMNRDYGAEEACRFVKRLDFERSAPAGGGAFR
jgi:sugar phosphate isomerase/epimerase